MNFLKKSLVAFIFFAFTGNIVLANTTNTTPAVAKTQNVSLLKRAYSKVADTLKAGASFVGNNPKKCLAIAAAVISAGALYWYLYQIPAPVMSYDGEKSIKDICPNDPELAKCINEAKEKFSLKFPKFSYNPKTQCATPYEKCMYHETGYRGFRDYCHKDSTVITNPEETDYVMNYCSNNGAIRSSVEEIYGKADQYCQNEQNLIKQAYIPGSCDSIAKSLAKTTHKPVAEIQQTLEDRDCYPTPATKAQPTPSSSELVIHTAAMAELTSPKNSTATNSTANSQPKVVNNPVCFANETNVCPIMPTTITPKKATPLPTQLQQVVANLTKLINQEKTSTAINTSATCPIGK